MEKRWVLKEKADYETVRQLSTSLNINERLSSLLVQRSIKTFEDARSFFRPKLEFLHDPFLMKDMDKAVDRIDLAHERGEKIMIYGDYDVDGTTAVSLVYSFLKTFHKKIEFYIPDRYKEGYGISYIAIDFAVENKVTLLIALDCGIKAVEKVAYAKEKGLDIIIGDHHRPGDVLPDAAAVLDPKQDECNYPFKDLSGCGVGFKLIQAVAIKRNIPEDKVIAGIDLTAVSIAADIVPIVGENRVLAYYGLKMINENPRAGIRYLFNSAGVRDSEASDGFYFDREITISDMVFVLGPRINAAGRIEDATDSVKLLISNNDEYAIKLGTQINELNATRRDLDSNITAEAVGMLTDNVVLNKKKTTVVYRRYYGTWRPRLNSGG